MNIELDRFRVLPGKSERVDEWMAMLNARLDECLATFPREHMYIEMIFRERNAEGDYLYWFSIQGEQGASVETSEHSLDRDHIAFWNECIDPVYVGPRRKVSMDLQVSMIPKYLLAMMTPQHLSHSE